MAITSIDQVTKDLGENHLTNPEGDAPPPKRRETSSLWPSKNSQDIDKYKE
jgi:hypothetical protein